MMLGRSEASRLQRASQSACSVLGVSALMDLSVYGVHSVLCCAA